MIKPLLQARFACVVLLAALALGASGCKKQRAKMNINKLNSIISQAETLEATKYDAPGFTAAQTARDAANGQMTGQQYDPAYTTSRDAVAAAETMLENVKKARSADLQNRANADIEIAQANNGNVDDPKRFQEILEFRDKGREEYSDNDWDGAIKNFQAVVDGVDALLAPLRSDAEKRLADLKARRTTDMDGAGVRTYAVEEGINVDNLLKEAEDQIVNQRKYRTAGTILSNAEQQIAKAIERAKEVRSQILINDIEGDLMVTWEAAEVFFNEQLKNSAEAYESLLVNFEKRDFDSVLQAGALLQDKARKLRIDTRQKSAETKLASLKTVIDALVEGGGREFLPGSPEVLEQLYADAKKQFDTAVEEGYLAAERIVEGANEEYERIRADFNELANNAIADANKELDIANQVFGASERIFDVPAPGSMSSLENQLEVNKKAMLGDIHATLDSARLTLETSQLKRDNQIYKESILLAEDVSKAAELVQNETYRVVAHNTILETQARLFHYDTQGGRQYAPAAVDLAKEMIQEAKNTLNQEKPKEAVDKAALAKAQLDVVRQQLSEKGGRNIVEAEKAIHEALDNDALQFESERIGEARIRLEAALSKRDPADYKGMIEDADKARALAEGARQAAERKLAEAHIDEARSELGRADKSVASLYAPQLYREGQTKADAAAKELKAGNYEDAQRLAREAERLAHDAAFERVLEAREEIATAESYQAWKYTPETLADAKVSAERAQRAGEAGDFETARLYANRAIELGRGATSESKAADVSVRIADISAGIDEGVGKGANYFQVTEVKTLIERIAEVERTYQETNYESAAAELRDLEARLAELLVNTPAVLERAVAQTTARRQALIDGPVDVLLIAPEEMDLSEKSLRYAKIDFEKGSYRSSYMNLRKGMSAVQTVETMVAASTYNEQIERLLDRFIQAQDDFRQVLSVSEEMIVALAINNASARPDHIAMAGGKLNPNEFREEMDDLYRRALAIKPPPVKVNTHKAVTEIFMLARRSALNFEKFVLLDQYDKRTAREIVRAAYDQINEARRRQSQVEKTFNDPNFLSEVVSTRKAIGLELH